MFPYPKWPQNHHFWGGISALCCAKNSMFRRLSGTWPTLEALFSITSVLACILKQIFIFSALILPLFLGTSVDRHFYLRLHSGSNFHISTLGFVTPLEKLCLMSFASRMYFWLSFHISALDFVTTLEQLHMMSFASRMHFWFKFHLLAVDFVIITEKWDRRSSIACSCSHIISLWPIKNWRAAVCPPQRAFNESSLI